MHVYCVSRARRHLCVSEQHQNGVIRRVKCCCDWRLHSTLLDFRTQKSVPLARPVTRRHTAITRIIHLKMVVPQGVSTTRTPEQVAALQERTNLALLDIVRDNFNTQYASKAPSLARFRDAVDANGGTFNDDSLLADFRSYVSLSTYDAYKPFVDKFNARPCKEEDVKDLLSPGLPDFLAVSSATSGATPKVLLKYNHNARLNRPPLRILDPKNPDPLAALICTQYREVREIEDTSGQVVQRIPLCIVTGGVLRRSLGWYIDDERRLSSPVAGYAVPWAATTIGHLPSFLIIHALFFLAHRDLDHFAVPFATLFLDLIRHMDAQWPLLVACVRDGTVPDLQGIDHIRAYLQKWFFSDPERAAELLDIGPPSSREGWFTRVWPSASMLSTVCSGQFATILPKVRSIVGPNVSLRSSGYRASEATIGLPHDPAKLDEFVLKSDSVIEFLDVSRDETHQELSQPWDVHVGRQYEPVVTTRDGLWRYRLGDVVSIVGFDAESGAPIFKYSGRRSFAIRLADAQITDAQLLAAIQALNDADRQEDSDVISVQEFTTVIDDRDVPPTVGFLVELAEPLGSNAHQARQRLFEALVTTNAEHGQMRCPTIRIVEAGTFAKYRERKGEFANVVAGQIKVPLVLVQPEVQTWFLERVVREL
ncbi:hypothetical protein OG21DRAFT_1607449 [Imleria badia]|nr:hypothetical protein OG21DRAFT_1607449 [Imleria badia]